MKDFFKRKGWRICFAAYIFIYLPWFSTLEKVINSDYPGLHIINIPFDDMIQFALSLIIGMSLSLTICMIYPNGLTLRPDYIPDNFCGKIINALYTIDTSTNVFPSIHVYNSLAVNFALLRCKALKGHIITKTLSSILCILICLATVFLKQHSVVDVIGAIILYIVLYILIYVVDYSRFKKA